MFNKIKEYYYSKFRYYFWDWILPLTVSFTFTSQWEDTTQDIIILGVIYVFIFKAIQNYGTDFIHKTKELDSQINNLFDESRVFLYIISPYFNPGENRLRSIRDASQYGCEVVILVNRNALSDVRSVDDLKRLQEAGCDILIHPHLHSKIYLNEKTAITGSVNLIKGSFDNSLEMGVEITNVAQHRRILNLIEYDYLNEDDIEPFDHKKLMQGYCIRTKAPINYNAKYPIKYDEYKTSNDKSGKYCHKCGNDAETSVSNPLCDECI